MKIMYLDESGNHDLAVIDREYPIFVLGGVIVNRDYARTVIEPAIDRLKREYFGRDDIVLHTADIVRRRNGFERLDDPAFRESFYAALNDVMRDLDFMVVACAIRKPEHVAKHGPDAADPYHYALDVLVERFVRELDNDGPDSGLICAEKRRSDLDAALEQAWKRLRRNGTDNASPVTIDERIVDLVLKDKKLVTAGLELADLVVSPIGRHLIGKAETPDWEIIQGKFRRNRETYLGYDLIVLPAAKK